MCVCVEGGGGDIGVGGKQRENVKEIEVEIKSSGWRCVHTCVSGFRTVCQ